MYSRPGRPVFEYVGPDVGLMPRTPNSVLIRNPESLSIDPKVSVSECMVEGHSMRHSVVGCRARVVAEGAASEGWRVRDVATA